MNLPAYSRSFMKGGCKKEQVWKRFHFINNLHNLLVLLVCSSQHCADEPCWYSCCKTWCESIISRGEQNTSVLKKQELVEPIPTSSSILSECNESNVIEVIISADFWNINTSMRRRNPPFSQHPVWLVITGKAGELITLKMVLLKCDSVTAWTKAAHWNWIQPSFTSLLLSHINTSAVK